MVVDSTLPVLLSDRLKHARWARGPRARALVIDLFIWGFLSFVINSVYGVNHITSGSSNVESALTFCTTSFCTTSTTVPWGWLVLLSLAYFTFPEVLFGATPGKLLVGLRVVRIDGNRLGAGEVVARNLMRMVDYLPVLYLLGGAAVLSTAKSQRLGDMVAGTTVVKRAQAMEPGATRTASPLAIRLAVVALALALVFTIAFNYFGRPPLVIQGMYNTQRFPMGNVTSYSLGSPHWDLRRIIYPVTTRGGPNGQGMTSNCIGTIELNLAPWGWEQSGSSFTCAP